MEDSKIVPLQQWQNPEFIKMLATGMACGPKKYLMTDIICPECEEFLLFTEPNIVHLDPPRKRVKCSKCEYRGFHNVDDPGPLFDIESSIEKQKS